MAAGVVGSGLESANQYPRYFSANGINNRGFEMHEYRTSLTWMCQDDFGCVIARSGLMDRPAS